MAGGNLLVVEELFASADDTFLVALHTAGTDPTASWRAFAEKWSRDSRPWARAQLLRYAGNKVYLSPGHRLLVRLLMQFAESAGDDEVMGAFLALFDTPRRSTFTLATWRYLRRRVWRYFRRLGHRDPARYVHAIVDALTHYREVDLLKTWGLLHALFHHSDLLRCTPYRDWKVRKGGMLRDLKPAPYFPEAWTATAEIALLKRAQVRPIQRTAMAMLKRRPITEIGIDHLLPLLEHDDPDIALFALSLVEQSPELGSVPTETWLKLLEVRNPAALDAICSLAAKFIDPARVSDTDVLRLCTVEAAPVARLAVTWLKGRTYAPGALAVLARVSVTGAADDAVAFARANGAEILDFLDSRFAATRVAAWAWFTELPSSPALWAKLLESPYDEIRMGIVNHLARRADKESALRDVLDGAPIETIWATVLFNVHRGSRAKRHAAIQVADAIERTPSRAAQLMPLLSVAARSIRAPEFRAGLAAVVRAARAPEVAAAIAGHFPELKL